MVKKILFYIFITLSALTLSACGNSGSSSSGGGGGTSGPAAPANPGATAGDQRVTVTWNSVAGATSYNVYWSTTMGTGTGGTMVNVTTSPYYHDGVTNTTPYYYVVTAVDGVGESNATSEVAATPMDIPLSGLVFADANLAACVNALALTNVNEVTTLNCNSMGITSVGGIEALTSLTSASFYNNAITDVSPLVSLTGLTFLNLSLNNVSDVSALASLTSLTLLSANNNNITDVSALVSLDSLTFLSVGSNAGLTVDNLNVLLPSLTSLTDLYLLSLGINDAGLSSLALNLTGLTLLDIAYNNIIVVDPLASLTGLTSLRLQSNNIADVTSLAGLTGLTNLDVAYNSIIDVSPLATLTGLGTLRLRNNIIGGQGVGNVDSLSTLVSAAGINFAGNMGMSCLELSSLITALGSPPVDLDSNLTTVDVATDGANCANP